MTFLIFPHQLFELSSVLKEADEIILIEEFLFFRQYPFHKQKICWQRASMRAYFDMLISNNLNCRYIDALENVSDIRLLMTELAEKGVRQIAYFECSDNWLNKRLHEAATKYGISLIEHQSPMFLNSVTEVKQYFSDKKRNQRCSGFK